MKKIFFIFVISMTILFIAGCNNNSQKYTNFDEFAKCLSANDAKFYGAFWCPHCQNTKKAFGESFKSINSIECSTPEKTQTPFCDSQNITGYPTWVFKDGSRIEGEVSFEKLAEKTGCVLKSA